MRSVRQQIKLIEDRIKASLTSSPPTSYQSDQFNSNEDELLLTTKLCSESFSQDKLYLLEFKSSAFEDSFMIDKAIQTILNGKRESLESLSAVRHMTNVLDFYEVEGSLGNGSFGKVVQVKCKEDGVSYAVKVIPNKAEDSFNFFNELRVLKLLNQLHPHHPRLMSFHDAMKDDDNYYLICELCRGPLLFDHIMANGNFSENTAAVYVRQILEGLLFLHDNSIVHRDLKPENLMFSIPLEEGSSSIKIIDFGCSAEISKHSRNTHIAGTPWYIAPEMLLSPNGRTMFVISAVKEYESIADKKPSGKDLCASDMWSVGVLVYLMLFGRLPFDGRSRAELFQEICSGKVVYPDCSVSSEGIDFIGRLLRVEWWNRMSCREALNHSWVNQ